MLVITVTRNDKDEKFDFKIEEILKSGFYWLRAAGYGYEAEKDARLAAQLVEVTLTM